MWVDISDSCDYVNYCNIGNVCFGFAPTTQNVLKVWFKSVIIEVTKKCI